MQRATNADMAIANLREDTRLRGADVEYVAL